MEPGDVVRLDPTLAGAVTLSTGQSDALVLGVVPGVTTGFSVYLLLRLKQESASERKSS